MPLYIDLNLFRQERSDLSIESGMHSGKPITFRATSRYLHPSKTLPGKKLHSIRDPSRDGGESGAAGK